MQAPYIFRRFNRAFTNRVLRLIAWLIPPFAIVRHRGRKSGRIFNTPVAAYPTPTGFAIPMGYGRDVDWGLNLLAAGGGVLTRIGRDIGVTNPRIVDTQEAAPQLSRLFRSFLVASNFPGFLLVDKAKNDCL